MAETLVQIVESLEPAERDHLSAIRVALDGDHATATLSISLFLPAAPTSRAGAYTITAALTDLPRSVAASGWTRYPDIVRRVGLDDPLDQQIRALHASGLVGALDASRFDGGATAVRAGHPATSWIIKTHAGSAREHQEWVTRGHGGVRPGAGRKPIAEDVETVRVTVTLSAQEAARLKQLGDGNTSKGVRRLLDAISENDNQEGPGDIIISKP